jgi:putative DNA methylase
MAVFSKYAKVVEADGTTMTVKTALGVINTVLDEVLSEQEGEYDPSTRWALAWYEQFGYVTGSYGVAEVLAKAKAIAVEALVHDGFLEASAGKVRLLRRDELSAAWNPATDTRLTVWEITQYLVKELEDHGEGAAAALGHAVGPALGETARDLAYRLYSLCERKGWAKEAMQYNSLVVAWPEIVGLAASQPTVPHQTSLIEE